MRFSWPVMGRQPACCMRYKVRLRYSFTPPWSFFWCCKKDSSQRKLSSHSWHTRGPHKVGVFEKTRRAWPEMLAPLTYSAGPIGVALAAFTWSLYFKTNGSFCKAGSLT